MWQLYITGQNGEQKAILRPFGDMEQAERMAESMDLETYSLIWEGDENNSQITSKRSSN